MVAAIISPVSQKSAGFCVLWPHPKGGSKMKKMVGLIIFIAVLSLISCGGGGGEGGGGTNSYIGFTSADFSGKTLYYVNVGEYAKAVFQQNGNLQAYLPNQNSWYEQGIWSVTNGKLVISRIQTPNDKTIYTLITDDTGERYFRCSRVQFDGETDIVGLFYDQITGFSQAQNFVANNRQP